MKRKDFLRSIIPAAVGTMIVKQGFSMPDPVNDAVIKMPRYLRPGDTIGITCPAGPMMKEELKQCEKAIEDWGFKLRYGNTVDKHWQRFGGTDEERAADMQRMLDDDRIDAILFARGGYGSMRMMDKIDWGKFAQNPKWLIGYSDITAFHCHVHATLGIPTLHADMGNGFSNKEDEATTTLRELLVGKQLQYRFGDHRLNRTGTATGKLVGGNLSLLVAMQGSKSALRTEGKILFIEDVSEYKYTVDRMMMNLKRSGMLDNLAGLVVGAFTKTKPDTEEPYTMSTEEIIYSTVKEYGYPVAFRFPAGHQERNLALRLGTYHTLEVGNKGSLLMSSVKPVDKMIEMPRTDSLMHTTDSLPMLKDSTNRM